MVKYYVKVKDMHIVLKILGDSAKPKMTNARKFGEDYTVIHTANFNYDFSLAASMVVIGCTVVKNRFRGHHHHQRLFYVRKRFARIQRRLDEKAIRSL